MGSYGRILSNHPGVDAPCRSSGREAETSGSCLGYQDNMRHTPLYGPFLMMQEVFSQGALSLFHSSATFSPAVSTGIKLKDWKINPIFWRRVTVSCLSSSSLRSIPSSHTLPEVGLSNPPACASAWTSPAGSHHGDKLATFNRFA